jgi:hypothetical protein
LNSSLSALPLPPLKDRQPEQKTVQYPIEAKMAAEIIAQMKEKNRKMAVAILKSMKKQEDEEKGVTNYQ